MLSPRRRPVVALGQHLARDGVPGFAAMHLAQELLDKIPGRDRFDLVDHPAALTAHATATHVEHLHGGFELVLGEGDDVGIGAIAKDDRLLLEARFSAPMSSRNRAARSYSCSAAAACICFSRRRM